MDAAEQWLTEHDPDYDTTAEDWRHLDVKGEGKAPAQEFAESVDKVAWLEATGRGSLVEGALKKLCAKCYELFEPKVPWQRFHTDKCRERARPKRKRAAYMREYRARKRETAARRTKRDT